MKAKLSTLKYGDKFTLLKGSRIIYTVVQDSGVANAGIEVKDSSGATGRLSGSRYVYKVSDDVGTC